MNLLPDQIVETSVHHFTGEASDLGIRPGIVPKMIRVAVGNGRPFLLQRVTSGKFEYSQEFGCVTLTIYND